MSWSYPPCQAHLICRESMTVASDHCFTLRIFPESNCSWSSLKILSGPLLASSFTVFFRWVTKPCILEKSFEISKRSKTMFEGNSWKLRVSWEKVKWSSKKFSEFWRSSSFITQTQVIFCSDPASFVSFRSKYNSGFFLYSCAHELLLNYILLTFGRFLESYLKIHSG